MKTLQEVAKVFIDKTQSLIKGSSSGWKKAPYDTGNLYRSIGSFNTPGKVAYKQGKRSFLNLNYAPSGATYGLYVEKGTSRMASRPFAETAANSSEVKSAIREYQNSEVDEVRKEINKRMTIIMKDAGFKKK